MRTNTTATRSAFGLQPRTHEGALAYRITPLQELRRTILSCMLFEDTFYEKGSSIASRIESLCLQVKPEEIADLALEARTKMKLRHAPLFLIRQLARRKGHGTMVANALYLTIQRADELAEFVAMYFKGATINNGKRADQPLSAGVKRGLAMALRKFDEYALGKYVGKKSEVKLKDVLRLVHPKPDNAIQAQLWNRVINNTLVTPDTWETELSAGADKRETFTRLLQERKLGGMAVLRNLRNMIESGVDENLIRDRIENGIKKALPFRFITAARYAPNLTNSLEIGMFRALEDMDKLPGKTGLLIDVSGSMDVPVSDKSEVTRLDAACGLAIIAREKCEKAVVATFSNYLKEVPNRRGFDLSKAVVTSQGHGGTNLGAALQGLVSLPGWSDIDRLIIITDEQSGDPVVSSWSGKAYLINVGTYQNGVSYGNSWVHIDGWSESCVDFIGEYERGFDNL